MKKTYEIILICSLLLSLSSCRSYVGGANITPLTHAHAHNDYEHDRPLYDALDCGFNSVEADVFLVDNDLYVAHNARDIAPNRTLRLLYLEPLKKRIMKNGGCVYPKGPQFILLIDFKTDAVETYKALDKILTEYQDIFTSFGPNGRSDKAVLAIISGNRPRELMEARKLRYAACDGRLPDIQSKYPADLVPMISDNWTKYFTWDGTGKMPTKEHDRLKDIVQKAHEKGRLVRFWSTPDNPSPAREAIWRELLSAGADLINTDDLEGLRQFLLANQTRQVGRLFIFMKSMLKKPLCMNNPKIFLD